MSFDDLLTVSATLRADLEDARAHAKTVADQLLEANRLLGEANSRLSSTHAELAASRAMAKAHVTAGEWLEGKVRRVEIDLVAAQKVIAEQSARIVALEAQIEVYERSRSWRLTAPLRAARRFKRAPAVPSTPDAASNVSVITPTATAAEPDRSASAPPRWFYEEKTTDFVPLDRSKPVETLMKLIAFYLPQFHPIPENDEWWGKGFTEWTSVTRAKPQFEGHYQPHLPGELGFYDLRLPEIQRRQVELARLYGVHGFCYYHYWFHGKTLLRRPLEQLLAHPEIDFPFCLCWANENWSRRWDGLDHEVLLAQQHSPEDDLAFIRDIEPALRDPRYIRVDGRPLLIVYRPALFPDAGATAERWRLYCREAGVGELFLMSTHAFDNRDPRDFGFDAALEFAPNNMPVSTITAEMTHVNPGYRGYVHDYRYLVESNLERKAPDGYTLFRSVTPMWDNEARRPSSGTVYANSTPELYRTWLTSVCHWTERHVDVDKRFVFVNAWNEWAEGAHLEPDRRYGYAYLQATAEALERFPVR